MVPGYRHVRACFEKEVIEFAEEPTAGFVLYIVNPKTEIEIKRITVWT